jgi:hypothetical protein
MQRRTFLSGLVFLGGGLVGHGLTTQMGRGVNRVRDPKAFAAATTGVNLHGASTTLLLKLFSRQVTDHDRQVLVAEVVSHNRELFIVHANAKKHGLPGFYRVAD